MPNSAGLPHSETISSSFELSFSTSSAVQSKVIVISHERSGTHFLMNALACNSCYISAPWINLDKELGINFYAPAAFRVPFDLMQGHSVRNIIKSHHEFGFYSNIIDSLRGEYKILYIYRDVHDVMVSYQRFLRTLPWHEGPKYDDLHEFITCPPEGAMTRYQYRFAASLLHRWTNHVEGWLDAKFRLPNDFIKFISFDRLEHQFADTMNRVTDFLDQPRSQTWVKPSQGTNVVCPNTCRHVPGEYQRLFTMNSLDYIEHVAGKTLEKLRHIELARQPR